MPKTEAWKNRITGTGEESPDQLLANPRNWRIHPKAQQEALEAALGEVGWVQQIIVNQRTGHVVDGHLRISLAIKRAEKTVPVVYVDLSEGEEALILATIDPLSALAGTDKAKLDDLLRQVETGSAELQKMLSELAVDNGLTYGLTGPEVDAEPQIDRAEELQAEWKTERGQVWQLGEHRLMCGDCKDVQPQSDAALLLSDPPYGIGIVHVNGATVGGSKPFGSTLPGGRAFGDWGRTAVVSGKKIIPANSYPVIEGDDKPFDPSHLLGIAKHTVLWGANYYADKLPSKAGWICWDKRENLTRNNFADCELAWTSDDDKPARIFHHLWNGLHKGSQHGERRQHPTEKPVALFAWVIETYTQPGELVLDPYVGSGTTIIAAEQTKRICHAIEIEPLYVAVCLQRYLDATEKRPTLITTQVVAAT